MLSISAAVASSFCVLQFAIFPAPTSVTGGAAAGTVIAELPLFPSLVAVIFAKPGATPVTSPLPLTVATPGASVDQVIARPESGLPLASSGVAVSCCVPPTRIVALVGLKLTDATGTMTVIAALPLLPSLVAVMVAVPAASAVTSPLPFTVATPGASLDQVIVRPESGLPLASSGVAVSCWVPPTTIVAAVGLTVSDATGIVTVMAAVAPLPSLVAVIFAAPGATAVTRPAFETVATAGLSLDHVTIRPLNRLPLASYRLAVSCCV